MTHEKLADREAAAARRARFGTLPEHIRLEDTVEVRPVAPAPDRDTFSADDWLVHTTL
ncbi:hypothetical protein [Actinacidiphila acidipaludis]|uniref:Uncharacterized protein n=1 Tax=Actinacidiphila acidipaludis TaxID=2873382 RepID=A0ABS7Q6G9_9ACTN|nr:hypothetical protein [Streptomyces acidipaludis]MBY8878743.1 hypothetical protein [Streptomyces acidipaludis]